MGRLPDPSRAAAQTLPPRSVTNMRLWPGSSAMPMPSIRWVNTISGSLRPMASNWARLTVLPCGGSPRSVQYSVRVVWSISRSIGSGRSLNTTSTSLRLRRGLACGKVDSGPQDPAEAGVAGALLRPVEMPADVVDGDPDAPVRLVATVLVALPGLHEGLDVGTVEVAAHHPHAFPVGPVQLAALGIEMKLLGGVGAAAGNDRGAVAPVEVDAFDRAVVGAAEPPCWSSRCGRPATSTATPSGTGHPVTRNVLSEPSGLMENSRPSPLASSTNNFPVS